MSFIYKVFRPEMFIFFRVINCTSYRFGILVLLEAQVLYNKSMQYQWKPVYIYYLKMNFYLHLLWSLWCLDRDTNMLHIPSDRFSPVRRLSDGLTSIRKYRSQLEKIYNQALKNDVNYHSNLCLPLLFNESLTLVFYQNFFNRLILMF